MNIVTSTNGFRFGAAAAWLVMLGASTANDVPYGGRLVAPSLSFALMSAALVAGVLVGMEALHRVRPRAMFLRKRAWLAGCVLGAACVWIAGALVALVFAALVWYDPTLTGRYLAIVSGIAVLSSMSTLALFSRRARTGRCTSCGYDLRSLTVASDDRCPECGQSVLAERPPPAIRPLRPRQALSAQQ